MKGSKNRTFCFPYSEKSRMDLFRVSLAPSTIFRADQVRHRQAPHRHGALTPADVIHAELMREVWLWRFPILGALARFSL